MGLLKAIGRRYVLIASIVITIMLLLFSVGAYLFIPRFIDPLQNFGEELPVLTKTIIYTYQYWVILPIVALITSIYIGVTGEDVIKKRHPILFLASLLMIAVTLIVLTIWGMYAPILALDK